MKPIRRILVAQTSVKEMGQEILRGVIEAGTHQRGWKIWKYHRTGDWDAITDFITQRSFDGAILHVPVDRVMEDLKTLGIPIINTSNAAPKRGLPMVCTDDVASGEMAGRYIADLGFESAVFLGASKWARYAEERLRGMRNVLGARRVENWGRSERDWWHKLEKRLEEEDSPLAVVVSEDRAGVNVSNWLFEREVDVPGRVVLLGFNNDVLDCLYCQPTLSSVRLPFREMGRKAVEMLSECFERGRCSRRVVRIPPVGVEVRQSSDLLSIKDPRIRRAVRFVQDHRGNLTVQDLLAEVPTNRRWLEQAFRETVGETPHHFILRIRAEAAKELLVESMLSITEIALDCGFSSSTHMGVVFQRIYGRSPREIRKTRG